MLVLPLILLALAGVAALVLGIAIKTLHLLVILGIVMLLGSFIVGVSKGLR